METSLEVIGSGGIFKIGTIQNKFIWDYLIKLETEDKLELNQTFEDIPINHFEYSDVLHSNNINLVDETLVQINKNGIKTELKYDDDYIISPIKNCNLVKYGNFLNKHKVLFYGYFCSLIKEEKILTCYDLSDKYKKGKKIVFLIDDLQEVFGEYELINKILILDDQDIKTLIDSLVIKTTFDNWLDDFSSLIEALKEENLLHLLEPYYLTCNKIEKKSKTVYNEVFLLNNEGV